MNKKTTFFTTWRISYFVVWLLIFGSIYIFMILNPEEFSFNPQQLSRVGDTFIYEECTPEECYVVEPNIAVKIYIFQVKYNPYISKIAWGFILIWLILNYPWLKQTFKKINDENKVE